MAKKDDGKQQRAPSAGVRRARSFGRLAEKRLRRIIRRNGTSEAGAWAAQHGFLSTLAKLRGFATRCEKRRERSAARLEFRNKLRAGGTVGPALAAELANWNLNWRHGISL